VSTAIDVAAGEVSTFVAQVLGEGGRFAYLLLTGGGCLVLGSACSANYATPWSWMIR
jgi:hypothetical protein